MSSPQDFSTIASAPVFVVSSSIQINGTLKLDRIAFQELGGINSEINIEQYISAAPGGYLNHTKQFGMIKPPTVTLKRGLDKDLTLWQWHQMALKGEPSARAEHVTLEVFGGGLTSVRESKPLVTYVLVGAWCAKISVSSAKAGEGFLTQDVVIACDAIHLDTGTGSF